MAHADATYNLSDFKDVVVTNAVKNADGTYTFTVNNSVFVDKYNEDNGYTGENKHETDDSGTAQVTLSYTEKDGKGSWTVAPGTSITFKVKCGASDTPELPTIDEILDVLYTKPVLVKCMNENREHEMEDEEYAVLEGTYKIGPLQQDENGDWTCYFEVNDPIPYLKQFINNTDSTQHMILDSNSQQILLVLIDGDWSAPNPDQYITTIEVTCDPTVVGSYDLTFNANGGFFGSDEAYGKEIYVKEDLVAGEHTLSSYVTSEDLVYSSTGEKVIFAGWTTEKQNKQVYRYNDADIPEIVETVTIEDQSVTVWAVWGYDENGDGTADAQQIVIWPADITVYSGGDGYSSVIGRDEAVEGDESTVEGTSGNGLPTPGFYITLPYDLDSVLKNGHTEGDGDLLNGAIDLSDILSFSYKYETEERTWTLSRYDLSGESQALSDGIQRFIYRLNDDSVTNTPIRLQFKDENGNLTTSDDFDISLSNLNQPYSMTIYAGALEQNRITADILGIGETYSICVGDGLLTVRGLNDYDSTNPDSNPVKTIQSSEPSTADGIQAHADGEVTYYINDSNLEVADGTKVMLLVDSIVPDGTSDLKEKAVEADHS